MYRNWTSLIKPQRVEFVDGEDPQRRATVIVEPLERGFGTTLGNALRRVLISSMQGAAISSVTIKGAVDAFSAIPGIVESVTDIVLNLKGVIVRTETADVQTICLVSERRGVVTAGDIESVPGITILNPDHPIATVGRGGRLEMLMKVTTGKGYVPAGFVSDNTISIDCSYSPVKYVSYQVSNARIGQQTDYDRLVLEIETNGLISPRDAVDVAARILREQLGVFVNFDDAAVVEKQEVVAAPRWHPSLFERLDEMELSVRSSKAIKNAGIVYIGDLVQKSAKDLLKLPNFGRNSLKEIDEVLADMGLSLGMELNGWPPDDVKSMAKRMVF
ncbi:MAG: DNA-directed RNA polymerase subunit alpha [Magnetococcales bacterium]|nr:DNA-directed RNA polymerase subunit alpha [Magnetococcales bacterium]